MLVFCLLLCLVTKGVTATCETISLQSKGDLVKQFLSDSSSMFPISVNFTHDAGLCMETGSYGHTAISVWVDLNCRGDFHVCYKTATQSELEQKSCQHMVLWSNGYYNETLLPYASEVNSMKLLRDGLLPSSQPCNFTKTFGYNGINVWVDRGCRARFMVCYKLGLNALVLCSDNGDTEVRHRCYLRKTVLRVESLMNQPFDTGTCIEGETFGFQDEYIWVSKGCKGAFRVTVPYGDY